MAETDLPVAVWAGTFHLFGVEVRCATLSDGRRVIEDDSMHELMRTLGMTDAPIGDDALRFARWRSGDDPSDDPDIRERG